MQHSKFLVKWAFFYTDQLVFFFCKSYFIVWEEKKGQQRQVFFSYNRKMQRTSTGILYLQLFQNFHTVSVEKSHCISKDFVKANNLINLHFISDTYF